MQNLYLNFLVLDLFCKKYIDLLLFVGIEIIFFYQIVLTTIYVL